MNKSYKSKRHFFTLLEVLVSMGVFTILMLALMQFFSAAQTVWEKSGSRTETFENARLAVQMLKQDLANAFYGDPDHNMSSLQFFSYNNGSSQKNLTFAAEQNGVLAEVDYCWASENDATDSACTFSVAVVNGDVESSTNWVTRNTAWINDVRNAAHTELLRNVMFFDVQGQYWTGTGTLSPLGTPPNGAPAYLANRPPALVYITLGVIREDALEKLGRMLSTPVTDLTLPANRRTVFQGIRTWFNDVFDANGFFIRTSLDAGQSNLPQRRLIYEGTQFFNILVHIDR